MMTANLLIAQLAAACGMLVRCGWDNPILQLGMLNFLLGDAVKIIFAAVALPPIVKAIRRSDSE